MKKALMMATMAALAFSIPAMANEGDKEAKIQMKVDKKFAEVDTNGDGMISKEEHQAKADKMFSETDANSDGSLSKDEVKAAIKKEWEEHKKK